MAEVSRGRPVAPDLLLLAVGERSRYLTRGPVGVVVAAGAVVDEVLAGRPLAELGPDRAGLAGHLTVTATDRLADVTQALVTARAVEPSRTKVLGLFPRDGLRVLDPAAAARVQGRLRDALVPGRPPAPADAALAALASVGGLARVHAPGHDRQDRDLRRAHLTGLPTALGPDLTEVVMGLRVALGRLGAGGESGVVLVPDADHDGYGDAGGAGSGGDGSGGDSGGDGGGGGGD